MLPDIKQIGLNLAEENLKVVIKDVVRPYAEHYIAQSQTKIDDILLPFLDKLEAELLNLADKIDGEIG